jgi:hypothetical protein
MANASVEKLKEFGIRHGEKIGVAVFGALCVLMIYAAFTRPTIEMTPEQVESAARQAQANLGKEQPEDVVLAKIEGEGVVLPGFEKIVDARKPGSADATPYQLTNTMVAPEPGAGLLRQTPELIAVNDLFVHSGRGAITVMVKDEVTGRIKMVPPKSDDDDKTKGSRRNRGMASGGEAGRRMGGGGYPGSGGTGKSDAKTKEAEKKERERQARVARGMVAGGGNRRGADEAQKKAPVDDNGLVPEEEVRGFRFVTVTGVLDHKRLRENLAKALKLDLSGAHPDYKRLDLERQELQPDGSWTDWEPVDREWTRDNVLDLLHYEDPETSPTTDLPMVQDEVKLETLVDPLPYLEVGYWVDVYPPDLVDEEAIKAPEEPEAGGGLMAGGMRGPGGLGGMKGPGGAGGPGGLGGMRGPGGMGGPAGGMRGPGGLGGDGEMGGGMSSFGSMFGGGLGGPSGDYPKSEADKVMIRALDFTVEPDVTYRYRLRLVIGNPNYKSESVEPGVDTTSEELFGPWGKPTAPVTVPADVATYVVNYAPAAMDLKRDDLVQFVVVRWEPETGVTVALKSTNAAPGQIIGEPTNRLVPDLKEHKQKTASVDFTSRRLLVDTAGGPRKVDPLKVGVAEFDAPAQALMLRPDGTLVLRDEASDVTDGEKDELVAIYEETLKDVEADKDRNKSRLMGGPGGLGGGAGPLGGR